MTFKELKDGYPLYIFDQAEITAKQAKAISVSQPHIDAHYGNPTMLVIDINVECDGITKMYTFRQDANIGYANNLIISTERESILREVEAMKTTSEQALSQMDKHENTLKKCNNILSDFNPAYKEKKRTEERFCELENSMGELKTIMKELVKELKG